MSHLIADMIYNGEHANYSKEEWDEFNGVEREVKKPKFVMTKELFTYCDKRIKDGAGKLKVYDEVAANYDVSRSVINQAYLEICREGIQ